MKVLFFGIYDKNYSRNWILMKGFIENGYEVVECCVDPKIYSGISKFFKLYSEYRKIKNVALDKIVVAFPGHSVVWLARILFGNNFIFDAFVSLHGSNYGDRKEYHKYSIRYFKDLLLDYSSCLISSKILLDTNSHIHYFIKNFGINKNKFIRVLVGVDDNIFYPIIKKIKNDTLTVHFHGSYIPLQGVPYIVDASIILKNEKIKFRFIGGNKMQQYIKNIINRENLNNIELVDRVDYRKLSSEIIKSDIALGIFGTTDKAKIVIPNKVYEAVASGVPVVTMNSPAVREVFTDQKNIFLCDAGNSNALAEAILKSSKDDALRNRLSQNALELFYNNLTPKIIVQNLLNEL